MTMNFSRFSSCRQQHYALPLILLYTACTASSAERSVSSMATDTDDVTGPALALAEDAQAFAAGDGEPHIRLRSIRVDGELCPDAKTSYDPMFAPTSFFVTPPSHNAEDGPFSGTCGVRLTLEVPANYKFRKAKILYDYFAAGGVRVEEQASYGEGGLRHTPMHQLPEDSSTNEHVFGDDWSPTCADPARASVVHLQVDIAAELETGAILQSQIWGGFEPEHGLEWARCIETQTPGQPTLPGNGERCSTTLNRPCAAGFECDMPDSSNPQALGICVNPDEHVTPSLLGEPCGGFRNVGCEEDFVCAFSSKQAADEKRIGKCSRRNGKEWDDCGQGYPDVACDEPFVCSNNRCRTGDGTHGSECGPGLPECGREYQCVAGWCKKAFASEGESCAPNIGLPCGGKAICNDEFVCVESEAPVRRPLNSSCANDDFCETHLVCTFGVCSVPLTGELGTKCADITDCNSGYVCKGEKNNKRCATPKYPLGSVEVGGQCEIFEECKDASCIGGRCKYGRGFGIVGADCAADGDCDGGLVCEDTMCAIPDPSSGRGRVVCTLDSDCARGFVCSADHECVPEEQDAEF